jgi:tetratricopeptide (TPR) repeat protein
MLVEFASVVDALRCATEIQAEMAARNASEPANNRIEFRIGIHQGDIVVEDDDIFGDGVNIAARLEGLAEPGGICLSARVQEDATGNLDLVFEDIGEQLLKNIARPVRVFRIAASASSPVTAAPVPLTLPDKPSIAVLPFTNMSPDPEQEFFADGIAEDVITALARYPSLFVIARNSSFSGRPKEGVAALQRSIRLDPHHPRSRHRLYQVALGLYFCREYEAAVEAAKLAIRSYPAVPNSYRWLAAALGQLGRTVEANEALDKAVAIAPAAFDMYVQPVPWMRPEDHAHMLEGLRKAGWQG